MVRRRASGEGSLFQRADGLWVGSVEIPGTDGKRRQKRVTSKDRNTCIDKLKKLQRQVDEGAIPVTGKTTVAMWLERWLNDIHASTIRPTTRMSYAGIIRLYINPAIGDRRLDRLTPDHVRQMLKSAREVSGRAAEKAYVVLKRSLDDAVREGLLMRNVAAVVHKPKYTAAGRAPFTVEEAKAVLRTALDNDPAKGTRWVAAFFTGARQGELLGLTWDSVDLERGYISLEWQLQQLQKAHGCGKRHSDGTWPCGRQRPGWCTDARWDLEDDFEYRELHRSLVLTRPKTRAGVRFVPLAAPLWVALQQHALTTGTNPHNLVWHHPDGRPIGPREDHDAWQALMEQCGFPTPQPMHRARHTTATLLRAGGVDEQTRMEIIGHSSVDAQRIYAHDDLTLGRQAMRALEQFLA